MYVPPFNAVPDEAEARAVVAACRSAWLVTVGAEGVPVATLLPVLWRDDVVIAHLAKVNTQWRGLADGSPALLIAGGPEAYVSPSWYASKAEHGKVVPTWNYSAVHLTGTVRVHHDPAWLRAAVTALTEAHEAGRDQPWRVADAPETYLNAQLNGIVGIEVAVTRVEGKAKLSQNRSEADRRGVVDGLRADAATRFAGTDAVGARAGASAVADAMADALTGGTASAPSEPSSAPSESPSESPSEPSSRT